MTTNPQPKIHIGTLIHGTLRNEDLLDAFGSELSRIAPTHEYAGEAAKLLESPAIDFENEAGSELVNLLIDALNEYALPHTYFGSIEGDGSDFGFWPVPESFEDCEHIQSAAYANGAGEFVDQDCNVFVEINDHGNITVSTVKTDSDNTGRYALVPGDELWSAV